MKTLLLITSILLLTGCFFDKKADNPQASQESCQMVLMTFKDQMKSAGAADGVDKLYYAQIAQMNLHVLLARGCCKYSNTCPVMINE